tara:strand:+ start:40 stop:546 length:507 start_codon:yes stop_codon:yes gene_type:complete
MENSELAFSIEDVQETLEAENTRERIEVTPGEYVCEIKAPLPEVRQDSKGHNKLLMPIEISGNAQFDGQWLFEAIYMNNQHDEAGKVKDGIGKRKVARYAHALGMKKLSNLSELEGKFVKVKYGPNKRGYNEVSNIEAFSASPKPMGAEGVSTLLAPPIKEESTPIPF